MEQILEQATERERNYDWKGAKELYEKALKSTPASRNLQKNGEINQKIAFCCEKASLQAEKSEDFRTLAEQASAYSRKAAEFFRRSADRKDRARSLNCEATSTYIESWLGTDPSKKRKLLDNCWKLESEALNMWKKNEDKSQYVRTCNDFLRFLLDRSYLAPDWQDLNKTLEEAISVGESAVSVCTELNEYNELSRALSLTSLHYFYAANVSELEQRTKELGQKCMNYALKAHEISEKINDRCLSALSHWAAAVSTLFFSDKVESSLAHAEEMLRQGTVIRDNFIIGVAAYELAFINYWIVPTEEDPDKVRGGYEKVARHAEDAIRHLSIIANDYFLATTYHPYVESYYFLACDVETNLEKKRRLLERAVKEGQKGLEHARRSGSPDAIGSNLHALSKALHSLSSMEMKTDKKKQLLEEALARREEYVNVVEKAFPSSYWVRGVGKNYEAVIRAELAKTETTKDGKIAHLTRAVSNMHDCLELCQKWASIYPQTRLFAVLGEYYHWFGGLLSQLHLLTGDSKLLNDSIEAYEGAIVVYTKADLPSRLAEAHWRIAMLYDELDKHIEASENFESASIGYETSTGRISQLKDFYADYARYMRAWCEIEKAKLAHSQEKYSHSAIHYENSASCLKSSSLWKYLAPNYSAWALLERAEDLSRRDKSQEAIDAFRQTDQLFSQAANALQTEAGNIVRLEEKEEAMDLVKACSRRSEYCRARICLEEARIYDKDGENLLSAEKYAYAARMFERLLEVMETESDRKEIMPFVYMCQAWHKMVLGEEKANPQLYAEAATVFLKARECSTNDRTGLLALGNQAFCKALEFGTMFESSRDGAHFSKAKQYLESASNYYMRAGHENSAVWINATQMLFDAYVYTGQAEVELDPQKKHQRYLLAEKCLERAAILYGEAGYVGKKNEIGKSLEKVKEKREFMFSLGEVLTAPSITLSTAGVLAPTMSHEDPVGLQRFEHADIQANLIAHAKEVIVGEEIEIELELANTGKGSALLMKVEGIAPKGFEIAHKPETYRLEGDHLNIKGKKLGPLKTDEAKFVLKATTKGTFLIRPRIFYQDETGEYKTQEPQPAQVTVKELGIWRWIKGRSN